MVKYYQREVQDMKKYEYKFVSVSMPGVFNPNPLNEHHNVINKHAEEGWRYNGYIPISKTSQGNTLQIELIFEREVEV